MQECSEVKVRRECRQARLTDARGWRPACPVARSAKRARSESEAARRGSTRSRNFWLLALEGSKSMHFCAPTIILFV